MAKPKYQKTTLKLQPNNTWTGTPDHQVIVLDRGAVRFDFPRTWVVIPDHDSLKIYDRRPPKDDCCLAVSYLRLAPIDWSGVRLAELVQVAGEGDERPVHTRGDIVSVRFGEMDLAWREVRFVDPKEQREARSRLCIARQGTTQALITFDFWETDEARCMPIWDTVLKTLRLNDYIADPAKGPWGKDA
jgi:hypothetical protein